MKVLHIATEKSWRGGENQLRLLIEGLKERDVESHLIVQPESAAAKIFAEVATTHPVAMRNDLDVFAAYKIARIALQGSFDLIHAHTARAHTLAIWAKAFLLRQGVKPPALVVHRRVEQADKLSWLDRAKYRNKHVDRYLCVSKAIARGMIQAGIPETKLRVVYSAVNPAPHQDHDRQRREARREFQLNDSDLVVCCVAAIEEAKGVDHLLRGWLEFKPNAPHAKLLMIGEGAMRSELEQQAKNSGYADSVIFTGFRRDVVRLMAAGDVLILPTLWEGLGTVLLDALLAGCAVIGTDVGGVPEIIHDRETGLLIPPEDSFAISQALNLLMTSPHLRSDLVRRGQSHVAKNFSLAAMIDGNFKTYQELLRRSL